MYLWASWYFWRFHQFVWEWNKTNMLWCYATSLTVTLVVVDIDMRWMVECLTRKHTHWISMNIEHIALDDSHQLNTFKTDCVLHRKKILILSLCATVNISIFQRTQPIHWNHCSRNCIIQLTLTQIHYSWHYWAYIAQIEMCHFHRFHALRIYGCMYL